MPITPANASNSSGSDVSTAFDVTIAVVATAEDLVTVPNSPNDRGKTLSLINDGPGDVNIGFDADATASDLLIKEGEAYDEHDLAILTKVSIYGATEQPTIRGILWSGKK